MDDEKLISLGRQVEEYCGKYLIPLEYFFDILNDQKVNPMMRGKGMEYNILLLLQNQLASSEWIIQKLNLNPQPNMPDVDIGVTHRRTGVIIKVESKPAVRDSMKSGKRSKKCKIPHFNVKCHRSRSSLKLSGTTNDRYAIDVFDIVITNPMNSIIKGKTIGPDLELIQDEEIFKILSNYYKVHDRDDLLKRIANDWRFVIPAEISEKGFIPRTPLVLLENDPNWLPINQIETKMLKIVRDKIQSRRR
ncbi:MAG: hypothetical protein FJ128_02500 [Deltaproteobacteria bacterium]|nr:hypothetical protein [Deltaproteobacteria bacterium]MBM4284108.1 hypothetical protein [Deltaproteobacteria bacterium]